MSKKKFKNFFEYVVKNFHYSTEQFLFRTLYLAINKSRNKTSETLDKDDAIQTLSHKACVFKFATDILN